MPHLRSFCALLLPVLLAAAPLGADATLEQTLDALHERGKDLKTLAATVTLTDVDIDLGGDASVRTGKLLMQRQPDGDTRLRVTFNKRTKGNTVTEERQDYVIDGQKLIIRDWAQKKETVRIIKRPGEKLDLFKLGEGPSPLPIGQPREEVLKEFDAKKLPSKNNENRIELAPKAGTRLARRFKYLVVTPTPEGWPAKIETSDANETQIIRAELKDIRANEDVKQSEFELEKIDDTWDRVEDAFQE